MYEKQCSMHTLYDCFVNECVLFVYRFCPLVFSLNFNVGLNMLIHMLFVKFIFEQFRIHGITIFIMIATNYTS